jgi:hypothetical protein
VNFNFGTGEQFDTFCTVCFSNFASLGSEALDIESTGDTEPVAVIRNPKN